MNFAVWNILDLIAEYGEEATQTILSRFSCKKAGEVASLNPNLESFAKNYAVHFAMKKVAVSYIVGSEENGAVLGIFTLAHKPVEIPAVGLSRTSIKTIERYANLGESGNSYLVSGFLIAQFGKNYGFDNGRHITGAELMRLAYKELSDLQRRAGGGLVYLDCEPKTPLTEFYENLGFRRFGERNSIKDGKRYLQYMKFF